MPNIRTGDRVAIRKGHAPGTANAERLPSAARAFTGDVGGARGRVLGVEVRKTDGTEVATVAITDTSRDNKATGFLDVPVDRLRHTGARGVAERVVDVARTVFAGAGPSRVLHGNHAASEVPPAPVPPSPYADFLKT